MTVRALEPFLEYSPKVTFTLKLQTGLYITVKSTTAASPESLVFLFKCFLIFIIEFLKCFNL